MCNLQCQSPMNWSEAEQTWTNLRLDISDLIWNQINPKIKIAAKYNSTENFNCIGYSKRIPSPGDEYRITPWRRFRASVELNASCRYEDLGLGFTLEFRKNFKHIDSSSGPVV